MAKQSSFGLDADEFDEAILRELPANGRISNADLAGALGRITSIIGEAEGMIRAVDFLEVHQSLITRDITINTRDSGHGRRVVELLQAAGNVEVFGRQTSRSSSRSCRYSGKIASILSRRIERSYVM